MILQLNEILTQVNNTMLLQNTLLRYTKQEYRIQDVTNNPSALLSTGNALSRVCYLDLENRFPEGCVLAGKTPAENGDWSERWFRLDIRKKKHNLFNFKESEEQIADG